MEQLLTLADTICDVIPFSMTCLRITPEEVFCVAFDDLFNEFKDK